MPELLKSIADPAQEPPWPRGLVVGWEEPAPPLRTLLVGGPEDHVGTLGPTRSGKTSGILIPQAMTWPGLLVCTSTKADVLRATRRRRFEAAEYYGGSVYVYSPMTTDELVEGVRTIGWSPTDGCEDPPTCEVRVDKMLGPEPKQMSENEAFFRGHAGAIMRGFFHAVALEGCGVRTLKSWIDRMRVDEAIAILARNRDRSYAAELYASALEGINGQPDETRASGFATVSQKLAVLVSSAAGLLNAERGGFDIDHFLTTGSSLFIVSSRETQKVAAPLVVGLIEAIVSRAYELGGGQDGGRLSPPLALILDEVAAIAPLTSLPQIISEGAGQGVLCSWAAQSISQMREKWGEHSANAIWNSSTHKLLFGGLTDWDLLEQVSKLHGEHDVHVHAPVEGILERLAQIGVPPRQPTLSRRAKVAASDLHNLERHVAVLLASTDSGPAIGLVSAPPSHTTPPFAQAIRASEEMAPPPVSPEGRPASAPAADSPPPDEKTNSGEHSGGPPSGAFPSLAPLLARAAHRTMALMIAGDPLQNKRGDEIEHFVGWLDLGSPRVPQAVPSAAVATTGLSAARRSALISNAIGSSRRTPRTYVGQGIDTALLEQPGLLHFDMTGTCMDDHNHVTWDPVSADCGEVLLAAQTLADVSADPDATWSPPPDAQAKDAVNGRTLQVMTIIGAVFWAAAREGWDMRRAVEQFSEEYFPSVLSMCEDMATRTGKGAGLCTRVAEFRDTPQQVLSAVVHHALDPLSDIIRATQSGVEPARLDLSNWLSGTGLLAITVPKEPTIAQLGVVNALLGAADALGWSRPGYLPPTVVWEGVPSPRHGSVMPSPWWLGVFDDAAQFLIWSELLSTQTPKHGCDWLIGAGTNEGLLMRLAQDTTPPRGDQLVLVHSDTDTFLVLD